MDRTPGPGTISAMDVAAHLSKVEYHPHGYPKLGLVARTLPLHYRRDANLRKLRKRLEAWEHARGNPGFQARHLEKLRPQLAFELAHVYVSLRERHPYVRPDYVDFMVEQEGDLLATASSYSEAYPTLRRLAEDLDLEEVPLDIDEIRTETDGWLSTQELRLARDEIALASVGRPGNLFATGVIEFGVLFNRPRRYAKLLRYWTMRNLRAEHAGKPLRVPPLAVSAASFVFIHEFGHLVEAELMAGSYRTFEKVYASLSEAMFGARPHARQWRYHLMNYPTYDFTTVRGPSMGSRERQRDTRRRLREPLGRLLGSYAPATREELFAEAFALSMVHAQPTVRRQLRPLQDALTAGGLRVRRLPNLPRSGR